MKCSTPYFKVPEIQQAKNWNVLLDAFYQTFLPSGTRVSVSSRHVVSNFASLRALQFPKVKVKEEKAPGQKNNNSACSISLVGKHTRGATCNLIFHAVPPPEWIMRKGMYTILLLLPNDERAFCERERAGARANPASFGQRHARAPESFLNILTSFFIDFATAAALYQNTAARDNNAVNNATPRGGRGVAKIPFVIVRALHLHTLARLLQGKVSFGACCWNEHVLQGHDTLC
jgi:hypothetical protein